MPPIITANTLSRAFSFRQNMINNATNYTNTWVKELKRLIIAMLTGGLSEIWHDYHARHILDAFIPIAKDIAYAEISEGENKILELNSPAGTIKIVQMINPEGGNYLESTLDGAKIDTSQFTTIDELQKFLKADLEKNKLIADLYQNDKENKDRERLNEVSTALQKFIRSYNVTSVKEGDADVPALRNSTGQAIAYKILPGDQGHFPYVAFPSEVASHPSAGSYKTLTHRTAKSEENKPHYVGLTLENSSSKTLDPNFLSIIAEHNLDKIIPQIRINSSQLIAEDLGRFNLHNQLNLNRYAFNPDHFESLASQIDRLHSLNIVHRDIKLQNMFFKNENVYLSDLDSLGKVGTFNCSHGTRDYLAPVFLFNGWAIIHDNADRTHPINAYKKDQYTFLIAMMMACLSRQPTLGRFREEKINQFLQKMPCSVLMKDELKLFLLDPKNNTLSSPLASYCGSSPM